MNFFIYYLRNQCFQNAKLPFLSSNYRIPNRENLKLVLFRVGVIFLDPVANVLNYFLFVSSCSLRRRHRVPQNWTNVLKGVVGGSGGDRELPTEFFRDFLFETYRLFIYIFQESVKMGIPVLKIATTFIMKCMNVTVTMDSCSVTMVTVA